MGALQAPPEDGVSLAISLDSDVAGCSALATTTCVGVAVGIAVGVAVGVGGSVPLS